MSHRAVEVVCVLLAAALLSGTPTIAAAESPQGSAIPEAAGTVEERVETLRATIDELLVAVARGDGAARTRLAGRTLAELHGLDGQLKRQTGVELDLAGGPWRVVAATHDVDLVAVREMLEAAPELALQLTALRHNWVPRLGFGTGGGQRILLDYHSSSDTFVAYAARGYGDEGDDVHLAQSGEGRAAFLERRGRRLAAAWAGAQPLVLGVGEKAQAAMALDTPGLEVGYVDTGQVATAKGQADDALFAEVRSQLEYIVNVKAEGPPLLKALRANLVLDAEFGFMAWGGRWPAFEDKMFVFRYDPARDRFLVRVEPLPAMAIVAP